MRWTAPRLSSTLTSRRSSPSLAKAGVEWQDPLAKMVLGMETTRFSHGILRYKDRVINDISRKEMKSWFYREVQPVFQDPFAAFSPLKRIDSYLYETAKNDKMVADRKEIPRYRYVTC